MGNFHRTNTESNCGPHPDYQRNLAQAERFCHNVKDSLLAGMRVKMEDSHSIKRALLMISWQAPRSAPIGNYANAVSFHQSKTEYDHEVENVFNQHIKRARKWSHLHSEQKAREDLEYYGAMKV